MKAKVGILSLGCPRNLVDSENILGRLNSKGYPIVDIENADIALVNTCAFIDDAKRESIDAVLDLVGLKKEGKPKSGVGLKEAEISANTIIKNLNLEEDLEIFRAQMLAGSSTHLSLTQNEKEARQFEISFTQKIFDSFGLNRGGSGVFTAIFDKSAALVKASFNPISIDLENVGTYPLINLGGVEKRIKSGQGKIVYSDSEELIANLSRVGKVNFTDINLVYFSDEENGIITPFWVLEGRTHVGGKGAHITVAVNAIVDRYLKE